jgi:hypothetical protein
MPQRANNFWTIFLTTVLVDVTSKRFAVSELSPPYVPHRIIDDVLRFTLAYNPEGAMSFSLGPSSRWWFVLLSIGTLFVLGYIYSHHRARIAFRSRRSPSSAAAPLATCSTGFGPPAESSTSSTSESARTGFGPSTLPTLV